MATTLRLEIVTPAGRVYAEDVEMVTLPGVAGQMGIYPHHVPLMTQMVPGEMIVRKDGHDLLIATGEGLIEVTTSRVAILTDLAIPADRIDEAKAEEARQRAEARLQEKLSDEELASVNASLSRDRKSTRLNSSHPSISYAVFCLKKKDIRTRGPIHGTISPCATFSCS